jgi:hypothetical protein
MFRYQWRAFWRRALRTGRVKFYLSTLLVLGWASAAVLSDSLSRAAGELASGQTASMNRLLLLPCLLWLVALGEDLNVSLSSDRLRRFPVDRRSLLALRLLSISLSPVAWLATIVSLSALLPLLRAPHPFLGFVAALLFFALTIGAGMGVSQRCGVAHCKRRVVVAVAALGALAVPWLLAASHEERRLLSASLLAVSPGNLVGAVAVASALPKMVLPMATLVVGSLAAWALFLWTFHRSLDRWPDERTGRRATSVARLPGRLGPLVQKEQRAVSTVTDLWLGPLLVLAAAAFSLSSTLPSTFRQTIFVIVCALNAGVTTNVLGLDRPAGLTRYLILPLRGRDVFLTKNVAVMTVVAAQLILLLAVGVWQAGFAQFGVETLVVVVLTLAHLAWGNVVSVFEPRRAEPYRFAPPGDLLTALVGVLIGSAPGVAVMWLLRSGSRGAALAIAAIVFVTLAAYYRSLQFAGRTFERRIEIISRRLA